MIQHHLKRQSNNIVCTTFNCLFAILLVINATLRPFFVCGFQSRQFAKTTTRTIIPTNQYYRHYQLHSSILKAVAEDLDQQQQTLYPPAISVQDLSCTHNGGETWQLKDVTYVLPRGGKVALVGRNGAGKSTFLKILADVCCDDVVDVANQGMKYNGKVTLPRDIRVAYVEQEPPMPSDITVGDALLGIQTDNKNNNNSNSLFSIVRRYRLAVQNIDTDPDGFAAASVAMEEAGGWNVMVKSDEIATKLRVHHLQDQPLSKLSGGERKRVALAAALIMEPDVLLLDEPTNFLSLAGVQWLSDLLNNEKKLTILLITHDRIFLDDVCDSILELDNGSLYLHQGNYASYLQAKEERLKIEDAAVEAAKAKYRIELEWMRRQPQARETKAKARIEAFYKLQKATKPRPRDGILSLEQNEANRLGSKIVSMRNVSLKFGDRVMLNDFSYDFMKGDRICLAGANGVGKTTFLRVLTGEQPADSGEIVVGDTVVLGMYDQLGIPIKDPKQTMLEFVVDCVHDQIYITKSDKDSMVEARRLLTQFEFPRQRWNERISVLSGGERRRLQMLSVFSKNPNLLILDEPSVDCDLETLTALESYLKEFKGVLLVVSHDRAFADKVTDHIFVFEGNGEIKDFIGTLSEYASTLVELESQAISSSSSGGREEGEEQDEKEIISSSEKKAVYKEEKAKRTEQQNMIKNAKKEINKLENQIEKLKGRAKELEKELEETSSDEGWSVLAEITEKLNKVNEEIEEKEMRWMEVAEQLEEADVEI